MSEELQVAIDAVKQASNILLEFYNKGSAGKVENKGEVDRVSEADIRSEEVIKRMLSEKFPDYNIVGEELGDDAKKSDYTWYVDPLCGSVDFIHGYNDYGLSVALVYKNELILGVCGLPSLGETLWAERGKGAFLNGERIRVSKVASINDSILTTHISVKVNDRSEIIDLVAKLSKYYLKTPGSFPYGVCNLAKGWSDGHAELTVTAVHRLAATMIVVEAGGKWTKLDGTKPSIMDNEVLLSNGLIHDQLIEIIARKK